MVGGLHPDLKDSFAELLKSMASEMLNMGVRALLNGTAGAEQKDIENSLHLSLVKLLWLEPELAT